MHSSWPMFFLWISGILVAGAAQTVSFWSIPKKDRTCGRWSGWVLGLVAVLLGSVAAYETTINWSSLPMSWEEVQVGQLWDNGGLPAIRERPDRCIAMQKLRDLWMQQSKGGPACPSTDK